MVLSLLGSEKVVMAMRRATKKFRAWEIFSVKSARTSGFVAPPPQHVTLHLQLPFGCHQRTMTRFRPCIDLHAGAVKQIVGGTLSINDNGIDQKSHTTAAGGRLKTNFTSEHPAGYYAKLYRQHDLRGGHVIMLGPGNEAAAKDGS